MRVTRSLGVLTLLAAAGGVVSVKAQEAARGVPSAGEGRPAPARSGAAPARPGALRFDAWPITVDTRDGPFIYATEAASNRGISPYQNNLAIGYKTLDPAIHNSPQCNSSAGFEGFCGDEVAFGAFTLHHDVTGRDNTAIGDHALANLVSGIGNTAVGSSAAANIRTTSGVDAFGVAACQNARDFRGPVTCIGQASLEFAGPLSQYTLAVGFQAGLHTQTAEFSTILGTAAGFSAITNNYSVLVGEGACHNADALQNVICIGTINGPERGALSDRLWLGGNVGTTPILYGDLRTNALGVNTTKLVGGAVLTLAGGNMALSEGNSVQWNGDAGISRVAPGRLAVGNGRASDASGTLELDRISLSSRTNVTAGRPGELNVSSGGAAGQGGHVVAAYVRTVPTTFTNLGVVDPAPALGDRAFVTDSRRCVFGTAVSGGGSTACPVYYDGSAWVAG